MSVCGIATDGETALKTIIKLQPDAVLVDLGASEKSGLKLIRDLRDLKLPIKLLVVFMFEEAIHAQRALLTDSDGYITKRETPVKFINAIRHVLTDKSMSASHMSSVICEV